jgi:hypothetical protein
MTTAPQTALEKPATDLATECRQVATPEILQPGDTEKHAASLNDEDLIAHVQTTLHSLRDNLPYLREARDRFAKPGQRVPVAGNPTWTEWVTTNLGKSIRTVQRWLEEPKEKQAKKIRPVKRLGDWQQAQRRINDFLAASVVLFNRQPLGVDVLIPALRDLVAMAGCRLVEPKALPEPKLEPTVGKVPAPKKERTSSRQEIKLTKDPDVQIQDPKQEEEDRLKKEAEDLKKELDELKRAEIAKETDTIAAKHGWSINECGKPAYEGAQEP